MSENGLVYQKTTTQILELYVKSINYIKKIEVPVRHFSVRPGTNNDVFVKYLQLPNDRTVKIAPLYIRD